MTHNKDMEVGTKLALFHLLIYLKKYALYLGSKIVIIVKQSIRLHIRKSFVQAVNESFFHSSNVLSNFHIIVIFYWTKGIVLSFNTAVVGISFEITESVHLISFGISFKGLSNSRTKIEIT